MLAGASVPLPTLTRLQAEYLKEATELWNRSISKSGLVPRRPALRGARLATNPAAAYTARMYLLNARTLMQLADSVEADPKTRRACASACSSGSTWPPEQLSGAQPDAQQRSRPADRASPPGRHLRQDVRQGHPRRPTRAPSKSDRNVATTEGGGLRNEFFQLLEYKAADGPGVRAPAADGAAVHQQVLHPRPAARQLADPLRGRQGTGLRRQLAQPGREHGQADLGRLHRAGRDPRHRRRGRSPARRRSTRWAFASAGRFSPPRCAVLAARGAAAGHQRDAADDAADLCSNSGILDIFIDEAMVKVRELTIGPPARERRPAQGRNWPRPSSFLRPNDLSCGTTSSATT